MYYTSTNIPKKYISTTNGLKEGFSWDSKGRLMGSNEELIVKNEKKLKSPRYFSINFQSIYSGNMHHQTRSRIVKWFHDFWLTELNKGGLDKVLLDDDEVIRVYFHYYDLVNNIRPDFIDNFCFLYKKTFMDTLVENGFLEDDNINFVRGNEDLFYEVDTEEERRLEISYKVVNKKTLI